MTVQMSLKILLLCFNVVYITIIITVRKNQQQPKDKKKANYSRRDCTETINNDCIYEHLNQITDYE